MQVNKRIRVIAAVVGVCTGALRAEAESVPTISSDEYKLSLVCSTLGCAEGLTSVKAALEQLGELDWEQDDKKCRRLSYYLRRLGPERASYVRVREKMGDSAQARCVGSAIEEREVTVKIRSSSEPTTMSPAPGTLSFAKHERDVSLYATEGAVTTDVRWSLTWEWEAAGSWNAPIPLADVASLVGVGQTQLVAGGHTLFSRHWELGAIVPAGGSEKVELEFEQVQRGTAIVDSEITFKGKRGNGAKDPHVERLAEGLAAKLLPQQLLGTGAESKAAQAFAPCTGCP